MKLLLLIITAVVAVTPTDYAADSRIAAEAVNALGIDLYHRQSHDDGNLLLSPYSIQVALAMTYAGADGETRAEMQRVLHYPADDNALNTSFDTLARDLADAATQVRKNGRPKSPIEFNLADRLFAQRGYKFRPAFLGLLKDLYRAPLAEMDFRADPEIARKTINRWVASQTKEHIRELIPSSGITADTRFTLVNAFYLRAPWDNEFDASQTKPDRFLVNGRNAGQVPMMTDQSTCGYARRWGYQVVTRSYLGGELQFVVILPDHANGLAAIEKKLSPAFFQDVAHLPEREVILHLPKFRLQPATLSLGGNLQALGMKTAFDNPPGSADFDRMAPRLPQSYLAIGDVFHQCFLALDEKGTEAAAATAIVMESEGFLDKRKPPEVRVDHPFVFAIQHVPSGACLFLGRVTDPR
jgi:serpin B